MNVHLVSLGCAVPRLALSQREIASRLERLWGLSSAESALWRRIVRGSGVERRHGVVLPEVVLSLSTAQRMQLYDAHAPSLAAEAATRALRDSGFGAEDVSDLILSTCTGFSAPGIDVELVRLLGLRCDVRRQIIGFMGCYGAITALRAATGAATIHPRGVVLVVSVELCSLHMPPRPGADDLVSAALFADGAAAAVVAHDRAIDGRATIGALGAGRSLLDTSAEDHMTWRIGDHGFEMSLSPTLPDDIRRILGRSKPPFSTAGASSGEARLLVHPGGPKILDGVEEALPVDAQGMADARHVLRCHGNMSSATVLFVLDAALRRGIDGPWHLVSFGPGLTVETIPILCTAGTRNMCATWSVGYTDPMSAGSITSASATPRATVPDEGAPECNFR